MTKCLLFEHYRDPSHLVKHDLYRTCFCFLIFSLVSEATAPIGLLIEQSQECDQNAVRYAVEYANEHIVKSESTLSLTVGIFDNNISSDIYHQACSLLSQGIVAVIVPGSSDQVKQIAPLFEAASIPVVAPSSTSTQLKRNNFVVSMTPTNQDMSFAFVAIMKKMHWKRVNLMVSSDEYGANALSNIWRATTGSDLIVSTTQIFNSYNNREIVKSLSHIGATGTRITLLVCSDKAAVIVINRAKEHGITGEGWIWIMFDAITNSVTGMIMHLIDGFVFQNALFPSVPIPAGLQGLIGIGHVNHEHSTQRLHLAKWFKSQYLADYPQCKAKWIDAVLAVAHAVNLHQQRLNVTKLQCIRTNHWKQGYSFLTKIKHVVSTSRINQSQPHFLNTLDILNSRTSGWKTVAQFNTSSGINFLAGNRLVFPGGQIIAADSVSNVNGKFLKVVTVNAEPFQQFEEASVDRRHIQPNQIEGINVDLMKKLSTALNFTFMWYHSPDRFYGNRKSKTGKWNGMMAELVNKKADMAVGATTINSARSWGVDFTPAFFYAGIQFLMAKEPTNEPSMMEFLRPFSSKLWTMLVTTVIATAISFHMLEKLSPYGYHGEFIHCHHNINLAHKSERSRKMFARSQRTALSKMSIGNTLWFSYASMIQQGYETYPTAVSSRLIVAVWWVSIQMMIAMYTSNLGALAIKSALKTEINSVEELYNQDVVGYGWAPSTSLETFFCETSINLYTKMCKKAKQNNWERSKKPGMARARNPQTPYAYARDSVFAEYAVTREPCDMRLVGDKFYKQAYGYALQQDSPYTEAISLGLMQLVEQGVVDEAYEKWITNRSECSSKSVDEKTRTLSDLRGTFIVIIFACNMSVVLVAIEMVWHCVEEMTKMRKIREEPCTFGQILWAHLTRIRTDLCVYYWPDSIKSDTTLTLDYKYQRWTEKLETLF